MAFDSQNNKSLVKTLNHFYHKFCKPFENELHLECNVLVLRIKKHLIVFMIITVIFH